MPEAKLRFVLIGYGYIGKRYIQLLSQHTACELVALVDTDPDQLREASHLNIPVFSSTETYFASGIQSDAAVVATPNGTHATMAIDCLHHGRHVLIEKPMALKKADAEAIIQTAKLLDKKAMVVLQNRFSPVSVWLKQIAATNRLGKLFFVQVNCFWNRDERYYKKGSWHGTKEMDGGSLFTQFSHFVDGIYWLFGDIKNIRSRFANFSHGELIEFEDTGSIHFEFESGGMGCINFSTAVWDKSFESSMTIIAENGSIKISGQYMDKIEHCHIKNYGGTTDEMDGGAKDNHTKVIDAFIHAVQHDGPTNAEEALHSVDMIERMYAACS